MSDHLANHPDVSARPPDWRYRQAARAVHAGCVLLPSLADDETRQLASYLRLESGCIGAGALRRLRQRYFDISTALELFRDPLRERACQLEALVLARTTTELISDRCDVPCGAVVAYRACFFSVGDQLNRPAYILRHCIESELRRSGDRASSEDRYLRKLVAYNCGREGLRQLYGSEKTVQRAQWCSPAELIKQSLKRDGLATAIRSATGIETPQSTLQRLDAVARITELLASLDFRAVPRNAMEQMVKDDLGTPFGP